MVSAYEEIIKKSRKYEDGLKSYLRGKGYTEYNGKMTSMDEIPLHDLVLENGKILGKISISGLNSIKEGKEKEYNPVDDTERETIDAYIKYADEYRKNARNRAVITDELVPDSLLAIQMKEDYEKEREMNPSLPEYGSYNYFINLESTLRPLIHSWNYDTFNMSGDHGEDLISLYRTGGEEALIKKGVSTDGIKQIRKMNGEYNRRQEYQKVYATVADYLKKYQEPGIALDESGNIDAARGRDDERRIERAMNESGYMRDMGRSKADIERISDASLIAGINADAYESYIGNKDVKYDDGVWDRFWGNYKLGSIGIDKNEAGYIQKVTGSKDIKATQIYDILSSEIQNNNKATFTNNGWLDSIIALTGQQSAQTVSQITENLPATLGGLAIGSLFGNPTKGMEIANGALNLLSSFSSTAEGAYTTGFMYRQGAGQKFLDIMADNPDISIEDAQKLAEKAGLATSFTEFALDAIFDFGGSAIKGFKRLKNGGALASKEVKLIERAVDAGISPKGAKAMAETAKAAGKASFRQYIRPVFEYTLKATGEGLEEGIQAMISSATDRMAKNGEEATWSNLLTETFNFGAYTAEDWRNIKDDFTAGLIIGGVGEGFKVGSSYAGNKVIGSILEHSDSKTLGKKIKLAMNSKESLYADRVRMEVLSATDIGVRSNDMKTVKLATNVKTAIANREDVSASDLGALYKRVVNETTNTSEFSAGNIAVENLEKMLINRDVLANVRESVVKSASDISYVMGDKAPEMFVSVNNTTKETNAFINKKFGFKGDFVSLYDADMGVVSNGSDAPTLGFVEKYSDVIVHNLEKRNSGIYKVLSKNRRYSDILTSGDLSRALSEYIVNGTEPKVDNKDAFYSLANDIKEVVNTSYANLKSHIEQVREARANKSDVAGGTVDIARTTQKQAQTIKAVASDLMRIAQRNGTDTAKISAILKNIDVSNLTIEEANNILSELKEMFADTDDKLVKKRIKRLGELISRYSGKEEHLYDVENVDADFINGVNAEIEQAIIDIRNGNLENVPNVIEVAELSGDTKKRISDFVGFDVSDFSCKIEKDTLIHIEKRHGENGEHDHSLSDAKDIARIGYVVDNFDTIKWATDDKGNVVLSKKYNGKDNKPSPVVDITKRIDGTYCISQVVPDTKKKTIWITSARIQKKADVGSQVPNNSEAIPQRTSETPLVSSSAIDMVPQKAPDVKYDDMQPSQDYSSIISVMGKTLRSDALGKIASQGIESMDEFAGKIAEHYGETGNISPYTKYFIDDGKSVIEELKNMNSDDVSSLPKSKVVSFDENSGKIGHAMSLNDKSDEDVIFARKGFDDEDLSAEEGVDNVSEREVNQNVNIEQTVSGRTDIHNENLGRTSDARAEEYGEEVSGRTEKAESQGGSREKFEQRRNRTKELRNGGKTNPREIKVDGDTFTYEEIPSKYISDDVEVSDIIRQNKSRGVKTIFISGDFACGDFSASGVRYGDTVYISYDNLEQSPTQINDHELVHFSSNSKAYANFKKSVFAKLTEKERTNLRQSFGKKYNKAVNEYLKKIHEALPDLPWNKVMELYNAYLEEEILANLNAGTLTLSVDVSEDIAIFRKAIGGYETSDVETTPVDTESKANNSPADYKNEIDAGARFSIVDIVGKDREYKDCVFLDTDIFNEVKPRYWNFILNKFVYENLAGHNIAVYDKDGKEERISFAKKNERVTKKGKKNSHKVIDKLARVEGNVNSLAVVHIDELLQTAEYIGESKENEQQWLDHNGWEYKKTYLATKLGGVYETTLNIARTKDGRKVLYALSNTKKVDDGVVFSAHKGKELAHKHQLSFTTIPQNNGVVNNNSMQKSSDDAESKYNSVSEKAEDVLKESVARDSNGKLKIMYRGGKENINVFDRKKSKPSNLYGRGFYFTDDKRTAERYGDVREYYLNIKNPLQHGDYNITKEQMRKFLEAVAENEDDYDIWNYGTTDIDEILDNLYGKDDFWMIQDVSATAIGDLVEAIELFNEVNGTNYDGIMLETETVIFDSSQAKLADEVTYDDNGDEIPLSKRITESKDVRFNITSNDSEGTPLTNAQQEYFKDSKIRVSEVDGWKNTITENGLLFPVYHGTNSGEFYEFDESAIGSANDRGWFGKGFYFAFTEDEAEYYGSRILKCYLNVKKPFIYDEEMGGFDGQNNGDVNFDFASFIINVAEKFPDIAKKTYVDVAELNSDEIIQKSFSEFADEIKSIYKGDRLSVVEVDDRGEKIYQYRYSRDIDSIDAPENIKSLIKTHYIDGDWMANFLKEKGTITESECDDILDAIERNGTEQLRDAWLISRFDSREQAEKNRLSAVVEYLRRNKYSYIDQHLPHYYMTSSMGESFTEEIRKRGYDGIIQSRYGDEVVVFEKNQIKLTSNTNPTANPDMRFNISSEEPDLKTQHYIEQKAEAIADEDLINAAKLNTSEVVSMVRKNSDLQKRLTNAKRQMTVSKAKTVNVAEVGKVVNEVISELQGTVEPKVIAPEVMQIYNDYYLDIKKAGRVDSKIKIANDKMAERLVHIAEKIIDSSEAILENEDYVTLKSYLRETRIKFPDYAKHEAEFGTFRKSHMGTFNLTNDGVPLDSAYQELCELFPHLFSREVTDPVDQLNLIDETLSNLAPDVYNPHTNHTKEATEYAVYRLVSALDGISATPDTRADRMYKKSLWEKEQAVEKVKSDYERKLDKLKRDSEEKISKLRKDLSSQHYVRYWEMRLSKEEKAETLKRYREKQKVALLKSKIRSVVSDFRSGLNKTEKSGGYPKELITTVADVCSVLDFHTDRVGKNGEPTKVSLKLDALKAEYDNLKDNKAYGEYAEEYSEELSKHIGDLYKHTKDKRIIDLSAFELENLYTILKEIRHELYIATKQIGLEKSISNMEIGEEIIKTWKEKSDLIEKDKAQLLQSLRSADASTRAFVLDPHRINRFIAGYDENSAWWQMYDQLNRGVRKAAKFTSDANKPFDELTSGNGGNEVAFFDFRTKLYDVGLVDKNGRKVTLTKSIMCELLMAWERDQGRVHLQNGGFKIPNISDYNKGHTSKALTEGAVSVEHITQEHINKIKSMLDSYDMEWINKARHLYNVDGKNAINQTSIQLVGREIAKAENYIRLYVDKDFVKTDIEGIKVDASIEGNGSLKSTVQNAKQPIVLRGLHENVYDHIDFVAKYSGLAIPIRNFNKVYNIAVWDADGKVSSVKELLGKKFGSRIQKGVVEQFLRDLQMPREKNSGFFSAVRGKWIGAIFYANLSSMLKQTTSYWTASSYLSESSLIKGLTEYMRHTKTTRSEISEHTGTLYKRAQGLSTTELGERAERKRLAGASSKMTKAINQYTPWLKNIPEGLRPGNWLQAMDCTVAAALWEACKIEVRDKMGISADNPEYMSTVTDLYDKVVEETQSNYDVLHRPEALKSTNELTKTLTMFQTDNLQQTGLIYDAYANMKNKAEAYKKNGSADNKKSYENAKKQFGKVVKARVYSTIWLSMVTMLGAMALRKFLPYKDEEENDITAGSVAYRSLINMGEDMLCTLIPVGGNLILNVVDVFNNGYDFLSEPAFDSLQNFIDTSAKLTKALVSDEEGSEKQAKIDKALSKFIVAAGNVTGIPVNNFKNLYNGVKGYALDIAKGDFAHDISSYSSSKALYTYGDLAACLTTGDIKQEEKILNYYSNNGKNISKASLTKEIKNAYVELYADDPTKGKYLKDKLINNYGYEKETIEKWPMAVLIDAIESNDVELQNKIRKAFPGISESKVKKEIEKRQKSKDSSKITPKNE